MKVCLTILAILLGSSGAAHAQNAPARKGWGYGFAGAGRTSAATSLHIGAGGEFLVTGGLAIGAEAARFGSTSRFGSNSVSLVSLDLGYHFGGRNLSRKLVPFAKGGLSVARMRSAGGNFGFGIQYWVHPHAGVRVEFQEHIFSSDSPYRSSFLFGIAFR